MFCTVSLLSFWQTFFFRVSFHGSARLLLHRHFLCFENYPHFLLNNLLLSHLSPSFHPYSVTVCAYRISLHIGFCYCRHFSGNKNINSCVQFSLSKKAKKLYKKTKKTHRCMKRRRSQRWERKKWVRWEVSSIWNQGYKNRKNAVKVDFPENRL